MNPFSDQLKIEVDQSTLRTLLNDKEFERISPQLVGRGNPEFKYMSRRSRIHVEDKVKKLA